MRMFARTILLAGAAFLLQPVSANATDNAGKAVAIALPIVAGGVTLLHDWDWQERSSGSESELSASWFFAA